ncbi:MAG: hypothetical protein ABMB14_03090 [Myxococcota bacterium]
MSTLTAIFGLLILAVEAVVLVGVYLTVLPTSGSWLNVAVGSIGLASMIAMLVYSVARRSAALRRVMRLSTWLNLHIFLGVQGVLFTVVHCMPLLWRHGWPILVNPGMLNLYAVLVVFGSGMFGRYLYAQVPKTLGGQHLQARQLEQELETLGPIPETVSALWAKAPMPRSVFGIVPAAFARRRALSRLDRMKLEPAMREMARRRVVLEHQKAAMVAAQRVFRYWIVLHRPIAIAMYLLSGVHVLVSVLFSTEWGWW